MFEILSCFVEVGVRDDRLGTRSLILAKAIVLVFEEYLLPDVEKVRNFGVNDVVVVRQVRNDRVIFVLCLDKPRITLFSRRTVPNWLVELGSFDRFAVFNVSLGGFSSVFDPF